MHPSILPSDKCDSPRFGGFAADFAITCRVLNTNGVEPKLAASIGNGFSKATLGISDATRPIWFMNDFGFGYTKIEPPHFVFPSVHV